MSRDTRAGPRSPRRVAPNAKGSRHRCQLPGVAVSGGGCSLIGRVAAFARRLHDRSGSHRQGRRALCDHEVGHRGRSSVRADPKVDASRVSGLGGQLRFICPKTASTLLRPFRRSQVVRCFHPMTPRSCIRGQPPARRTARSACGRSCGPVASGHLHGTTQAPSSLDHHPRPVAPIDRPDPACAVSRRHQPKPDEPQVIDFTPISLRSVVRLQVDGVTLCESHKG